MKKVMRILVNIVSRGEGYIAATYILKCVLWKLGHPLNTHTFKITAPTLLSAVSSTVLAE